MNYVRKTYVEFLYPGSFFSESSAKEVKTRDVSKLKVPKNAFGFKFFDILSVVVDADGKKVKLTSEQINVSPMHYYGGKIYTVAELKREFPNNDILISNIEGNGYKKAIRCRTGNWQPFEETDIFVEAA
jgi:uncharacterized protein (UPF0128 family)